MYPLLELFTEFARKEGISDTAFIVGGSVRDILMNKGIKDVDIAVKGDAIRIAELFAEKVGGTFVLLDKDFGIARVVKNNQFIDICRMKGDTIYKDLADRDITINAIAMPLHPSTHPPELSDPFNGRDDLRHRIIRMVSEKNLIDDPLRLLRVYRFSTMLNFAVEINTSIAVKKHAAFISKVAVERIVEELRHILKDVSSYKTIKKMEEDGLLFHVFPEFENIPEESLRHALRSYGYAEHILNNLSLYFSEGAGNIANYFKPDYRTICLKLTTLLPFDDMAEKAGIRLKMSNREIESIHTILTNHHKIAKCMESDKTAVIGFLKKIKGDLYPVLIFNIAQHCLCELNDHPVLSFCRELLKIYHDEIIPRMNILPLITGDDLIREFHLNPSPLFKEILDTIELMTLQGKLHSKEEALKEIEKILKLRSVM